MNGWRNCESALRSPANFAGHRDDPRETAAALQDGGCSPATWPGAIPTGITGSKGAEKIIIRGGSNIAPQEVEEALRASPAVLDKAGVIGMLIPFTGVQVAAFVSLPFSVTEEELRDLRDPPRL